MRDFLPRRDSSWLSPDSLQLETGEVCVHIKMPTDHPHSSAPLPGVYVKSYGHGLGLIWVLYKDGQLIGIKLTGLQSVVDRKCLIVAVIMSEVKLKQVSRSRSTFAFLIQFFRSRKVRLTQKMMFHDYQTLLSCKNTHSANTYCKCINQMFILA